MNTLSPDAPKHQPEAERLFAEGNDHHANKRYTQALEAYKNILRLGPYPVAWAHAGITARAMGDEESALVFFTQAENLNPYNPIVQHNLAQSYRNSGDYKRARRHAEKAIIFHEDNPDPADPPHDYYLNAAELALLQKDFLAGWRYYGGRLLKVRKSPANYAPLWDGRPLPPEQKLLVFYEQGIGEEILFLSCLPDVLALAPNTTVFARRRLAPAVQRSFPRTTVVSRFDFNDMQWWIPAGSLPTLFRNRLADFPSHDGYLLADSARVAEFRERFRAGKPRVGIAWGNPRSQVADQKAVPVGHIAQITDRADVQFESVQYMPAQADRDSLKNVIFPSFDPREDMENHLAHLESLDLVITNSGAAAHAAGALGVPVWVMLPRGRGLLWHWFAEGNTCPWYPSARLVRQRVPGEWGRVIEEVILGLDSFVGVA